MSDGFLHKYFLNNPGKRLHKWTHYFDIYERHFNRFRSKAPTVLEIGVAGGGSLQMWHEYFGAGSKIIGLDINPECKAHISDGIDVIVGSQDDRNVMSHIISSYPQLDIVIDDGSHLSNQMIGSFQYLYNYLSNDGVYLVEDTHANYWPSAGGGLRLQGTFMEFVKEKIDDLNAAHTLGALPISDFTTNTDAIVVYDSIVVFEKRPQGNRQDIVTNVMVKS